MSDPLVLLFLNPALREPNKPQVTVRRGTKWLNTDGQRIVVRETGTETDLATGYIQTTAAFPLNEVPQSLLDDEHDPQCRTPEGLMAAMVRAYPDITPDETVTVVVFFVDDPTAEAKTLADEAGDAPTVDEMLARLEAAEATPTPSIAEQLADFQPVIDFVPATFTRLFAGNATASVRRGVKQLVPCMGVARDKETDEQRPIRITRVTVLRVRDLTLNDAWESGFSSVEGLRAELRGFYPGLGDDPEEFVTSLRIERV